MDSCCGLLIGLPTSLKEGQGVYIYISPNLVGVVTIVGQVESDPQELAHGVSMGEDLLEERAQVK